jgi:hypothetical protein
MSIFPKTTPKRYLSGLAALNFPHGLNNDERREAKISLDPEDPLNELTIATSNFELGIFDCTDIFDAHGIPHEESSVWVATHARAIADMLLFSVSRDLPFDSILINEWTTSFARLELKQILDLELPLVPPEHKQRIQDWLEEREEEFRTSVLALIANGHAEDERRIRSGELHADSMFFISREKVKECKVVWNLDPSLYDKL